MWLPPAGSSWDCLGLLPGPHNSVLTIFASEPSGHPVELGYKYQFIYSVPVEHASEGHKASLLASLRVWKRRPQGRSHLEVLSHIHWAGSELLCPGHPARWLCTLLQRVKHTHSLCTLTSCCPLVQGLHCGHLPPPMPRFPLGEPALPHICLSVSRAPDPSPDLLRVGM